MAGGVVGVGGRGRPCGVGAGGGGGAGGSFGAGRCRSGRGSRRRPARGLGAPVRGRVGPGRCHGGCDQPGRQLHARGPIDGAEPRVHGSGDGGGADRDEVEPTVDGALREVDPLRPGVRHDHEAAPDHAAADEERRRVDREARATPGEGLEDPRPARRRGEAVVDAAAAGHAHGDEGERLVAHEVGEDEAEHAIDVPAVAHGEDGRVLLAGGARRRGVRGARDADLPPAGRAPEERLHDLDRVDPAGRDGVVARGQQAEPDADAVRRAGDAVAERARDPAHEEAGGSEERRQQRHEQVPGLEPHDERYADRDEQHQHDRGRREQHGADEARDGDADDRLRRGRVRVELGREEVVDPRADEAARRAGRSGRRGGTRRLRPCAGREPQHAEPERVGVARPEVLQRQVGVVAGDLDLELRRADEPRDERAHDVDALDPVEPRPPVRAGEDPAAHLDGLLGDAERVHAPREVGDADREQGEGEEGEDHPDEAAALHEHRDEVLFAVLPLAGHELLHELLAQGGDEEADRDDEEDPAAEHGVAGWRRCQSPSVSSSAMRASAAGTAAGAGPAAGPAAAPAGGTSGGPAAGSSGVGSLTARPDASRRGRPADRAAPRRRRS
ncbi:hypothetical protein CMMCAS02_04595 [Clavibacter michiganensis subsp. michiganensis]|nr:hypothetical protein CMMCAS02_04595 [Clavibacter michiganensis subsp. michiganensis]